jgi:tRNA modification GTPase
MDWEETICAISTPPGGSAIGVIRISGPEAIRIVQQVFKKKPDGPLDDQPSHTIHYGLVVDPATEEVVDEVLLSLLRKPRTYTREDMVEISCHGSPLLLTKVVNLLVTCGARLAQPGEFTKRAFLNGRIDLTQAEAVMDMIRSRTEASLKMAFNQLQGRLGKEIKKINDQLLSLLTHIEADIDFSEQDLQVISVEEVKNKLVVVLAQIRKLLERWEEGQILRDGVVVGIVGRPNVGKSSLLNAILQKERAIVASTPGTTRDVLEDWVNIRGITVKLMDMAGFRNTDDPVEMEGVRRAKEAIEKAHLVLLVMDTSQSLQEEDHALMDLVKVKKKIGVLNKIDLSERIQEVVVKERVPNTPLVRVSATKGLGLDLLLDAIREEILHGRVVVGELPFLVSSRHRQAIEMAHQSIGRAILGIQSRVPSEFLALEIRSAMDHLGEVIGTTTTEDLLDQVFKQFCIGK